MTRGLPEKEQPVLKAVAKETGRRLAGLPILAAGPGLWLFDAAQIGWVNNVAENAMSGMGNLGQTLTGVGFITVETPIFVSLALGGFLALMAGFYQAFGSKDDALF